MSLFPSRTSLLKAADVTLGSLLCRILGRLHFLAHREIVPGDIPLDRVRRVLMIRPGGMGDMIILLPVIRRLRQRFPDAVIDVVCEKRNVDVLKLAGLEQNALPYDSRVFRFLHRLRRGKYDVAVDTEQFHHFSAIFALFSGAPARIGFKVNPIRNPLYSHLVNYELDGPEGRQFLRLLEPLGVDQAPLDPDGDMQIPEASLPPEVEADLRPIAAERGFALLAPGSSTVYKLWAPDNSADLACRLRAEHGLAVALLGSKGEKRLNAAILDGIRKAGGPAVSLAGRLTLAQTASVMKRSRLFVGSDSGLAHLAVALGVPSVVLFGPSDHRKWGFQNARHAVVRKELPCAPCFIFGYHRPCRTIACMQRIAVDDVMAACRKIL